MKEYLQPIIDGEDLTQEQAKAAFDCIMAGDATPAQIGAFIVALRMKGETVEEIAGGAASMRQHAVPVAGGELPAVDTCGTGGDGCSTFNISTTSAFVVAGAGVPVAKHGNRAISSKCGSADVLAALGVTIDVSPEVMSRCITEAGLGFLFAPSLHPAMKHAMGPRRELGVRTIFNMLGPLTNPAGAHGQVIGVFDAGLTPVFAEVLKRLGSVRAFVVHGRDGMDELTTTTTSQVSELRDGDVETYEFDPLEYIGSYASAADLGGGDAADNAAITRAVLTGTAGAPRDIVCLNAATAIVAGNGADNMADGWAKARESIDSGRAAAVLDKLVALTG